MGECLKVELHFCDVFFDGFDLAHEAAVGDGAGSELGGGDEGDLDGGGIHGG